MNCLSFDLALTSNVSAFFVLISLFRIILNYNLFAIGINICYIFG